VIKELITDKLTVVIVLTVLGAGWKFFDLIGDNRELSNQVAEKEAVIKGIVEQQVITNTDYIERMDGYNRAYSSLQQNQQAIRNELDTYSFDGKTPDEISADADDGFNKLHNASYSNSGSNQRNTQITPTTETSRDEPNPFEDPFDD